MIKAQHISYGSILNDVSFSFEQGKIVVLIGENGCGKTTLIKVMLSLLPMEQGTVFYEDTNLSGLNNKERSQILSYVPQIKQDVGTITVWDAVVAGKANRLSLFEMPKEEDYVSALDILKQFGLFQYRDRMLTQISGGQLQMVYIARAVFQASKIMVMDEPCTFLDINKQYELMEYLKKQNRSIFMTLHDPNLVLLYADQVLFMHKGRIVYDLHRNEDFGQIFVSLYNKYYQTSFEYDKNNNTLVWKH